MFSHGFRMAAGYLTYAGGMEVVSGELWLWGEAYAYGELGDNTILDKSSPVQTVAGGTDWVQTGTNFTCSGAIKTDGTLWMWGGDAYGQLGDNTSGDKKSSPVQTVAGGTDWKQLSVGDYFTAAIKTDGTLWLWGYGVNGSLGDNSTVSKSSPVQTISGGTDWKYVSCGSLHSAAIKTDGTLWTWGINTNGQLGDNTITQRNSPIQTTSGGTNWASVNCGRYFTAAIKTDGTLWLWGENIRGCLGDNSTVYKSSPVQTVAGGTDWAQVSGGFDHTVAIKTDGTLWNWGNDVYGALGDNSTVDKSSPVQTVSGGTDWAYAAAGTQHTAAVKTDGTLWACGYNIKGQLGDGTTVNKSSPVQTISGGTDWVKVSCSQHNTMAIKNTT